MIPNPDLPVGLILGVLVAYSGGLMLLGVLVSRKVTGSGTFFVADRKLGPGLLFSTFLAANIGAGSIIGASGLGYRIGLSAWWWVGSAGIGSLLLAFWLGPRIWGVAREHGLYTAGDYLEHRYGSPVRATVAVLLWALTLVILAAQLIAMSQILEWVLGTPRWTGAVIGGVVMTVYFSAGGLLTSAWVNLAQLMVLLGGFAIAVPLALVRAGGWDAVVAASPATAGYLDFWAASGVVLVALIVPAFIVSPGLLQKAYGARSIQALRTGVALQGLVLMAFAFAPPLLGMIAHVYAPGLDQPELAVPTVLTLGLPAVLGAFALAAVFSAEVSSADAILFMLSTSLSKDLYKRYVAPGATDAQVLRVARGAAAAGGVIGIPIRHRVAHRVLRGAQRELVRASGRRASHAQGRGAGGSHGHGRRRSRALRGPTGRALGRPSPAGPDASRHPGLWSRFLPCVGRPRFLPFTNRPPSLTKPPKSCPSRHPPSSATCSTRPKRAATPTPPSTAPQSSR
jgi:SSS family solute:Na+ symporter